MGFKRGQLRDFVAVAEAGQVTTAARGLGLPQPLLSQSIRQLEHELGVELLEREPRGVKLDVLSLDVGLARRNDGARPIIRDLFDIVGRLNIEIQSHPHDASASEAPPPRDRGTSE